MNSVGRSSGRNTSGSLPALSDEATLIKRCRAGERAAEEEFFARYRRQIAANLYRVLNDNRELDDLVQEVFVIAFRGLDRFRGDAKLSTWLYRICVNVALGRIRKKTRKPPPLLMSEPVGDRVELSPETPEQSLQRRRTRERVHRILNTLSPKKRIVLFLHEIEGLDLQEISYIVEANPVTVRTRLHYARKDFYKKVVELAEAEGT